MLQSNYTREHREATQALLRGFVGDIVEGVASSRGLPEAEASSSCQHLCDAGVVDAVSEGVAEGLTVLGQCTAPELCTSVRRR